MTLGQLIQIAVSVSVFLLVFTLGLSAALEDATYLFRRPGLLLRSILSMNVLMVVFAVVLASAFDLDPAVEIAVLALAVSPVPPILPKKQEGAGGTGSYAVGLLVAAVLLAIVLVPAWIEVLGLYFGVATHMPARSIAPIVLMSAIVPLLAGTIVGHFAPIFSTRIGRPLSLLGLALLVVAVLPILFTISTAIWRLVGHGVLVVLVMFTLIGLVIGHLLGGPDPHDRTVLALATSARHPAIALAIGTLNFPERKDELMAVILCHLIISAVFSIPYIAWRRRLARSEALDT